LRQETGADRTGAAAVTHLPRRRQAFSREKNQHSSAAAHSRGNAESRFRNAWHICHSLRMLITQQAAVASPMGSQIVSRCRTATTFRGFLRKL
jgi:hypothetical protein